MARKIVKNPKWCRKKAKKYLKVNSFLPAASSWGNEMGFSYEHVRSTYPGGLQQFRIDIGVLNPDNIAVNLKKLKKSIKKWLKSKRKLPARNDQAWIDAFGFSYTSSKKLVKTETKLTINEWLEKEFESAIRPYMTRTKAENNIKKFIEDNNEAPTPEDINTTKTKIIHLFGSENKYQEYCDDLINKKAEAEAPAERH